MLASPVVPVFVLRFLATCWYSSDWKLSVLNAKQTAACSENCSQLVIRIFVRAKYVARLGLSLST